MRLLREEIARSHQTVDNDPIQYDEHPEVDVEMYANDLGTWSVKVSCVSNPSLSFPMQKFPDEYSANHYARNCADQIVRKTMNERKKLQEKYSLISAFYPEEDIILTEGLLSWLAGLVGKLVQGWQQASTQVSQNTVKEIEKVATSRLTKIATEELGEEAGSKIKSFDDLDYTKNEHRVILFKCQSDSSWWSSEIDGWKSKFSELDKVENWFPPGSKASEEDQKEWSEKEGKIIAKAIYGLWGFLQGVLEWWAPYLGSEELKSLVQESKAAQDNDELFGSTLKSLEFIKEKLNAKCISTWSYANSTLKVEETTIPLQWHKEMNSRIDKLIPIIEKASKEKAEKDFEGDLAGELEGMNVDDEDQKKKTSEVRMRSIISNLLSEIQSFEK